ADRGSQTSLELWHAPPSASIDGGVRASRTTVRRVSPAGGLPVRRRALRDHRSGALRGLLPLHTLPAAHRNGLISQLPRPALRVSIAERRRAAARLSAPDGDSEAVLPRVRIGA